MQGENYYVCFQTHWSLLVFSSAALSCRQWGKINALLFSDNKSGIYIWGNGSFWFIYIFSLLLPLLLPHQPRFSICWQGVPVSPCERVWYGDVFFRNARYRRIGRLDPGWSRLWIGEAPTCSLEVWKEQYVWSYRIISIKTQPKHR